MREQVQNGSIPTKVDGGIVSYQGMGLNEARFAVDALKLMFNDQKPRRKHYEVDTLDGVPLINRVEDVFNHEEGYLNITPIAKHFGKTPTQMRDYFDTQRFKDYAVASWDFRQSRMVENPHSGNESQVAKNSYLKKLEVARRPMKFSVKGGKYQGTYIHADIVLEVARFLNPAFAVKLDHWTRRKIFEDMESATEAKALAKINASLPVMVEKREEGKRERLKLTDAIASIYERRASVTGKSAHSFYYKSFSDLVNKLVPVAEVPKGVDRRDVLDYKELDEVEGVESDMAYRIYELLDEVGDDYKKIYFVIRDEISGYGL